MEEDKAGGCHVRRTGRRSSDLRVGRNKVLSKIILRHMASDRQQATPSSWFKSLLAVTRTLPVYVSSACISKTSTKVIFQASSIGVNPTHAFKFNTQISPLPSLKPPPQRPSKPPGAVPGLLFFYKNNHADPDPPICNKEEKHIYTLILNK